ncbi:hypothetical protein E4U57_007507 [Claviceps arundinis]|uniref:Uncharacterized protein n=1 Tax=Claviceps arundinis TaxID=1623583 RepID=A0ABQ7PGR6_9HYPO|nr:hypothetical protein E4U57_007507 [Claviceps arundinis]
MSLPMNHNTPTDPRADAFSKAAVRVFQFQETNWAPGTVPHGVTFAPVRNTYRSVPPKSSSAQVAWQQKESLYLRNNFCWRIGVHQNQQFSQGFITIGCLFLHLRWLRVYKLFTFPLFLA